MVKPFDTPVPNRSETLRLFFATFWAKPDYPQLYQALETIHRQKQYWESAFPDNRLVWVRPEQWHMTWLFLGSQSKSAVEPLSEATGQVVSQTTVPLLEWSRLSLVPQGPRGSVLVVQGRCIGDWAGEALPARLYHTLSPMCSGLKPPQWKPHITIARLKGNSRTDSLNHLPTALTHWTPLTIAPQALSLIESQLTPTGPEYQTLQSWPLTCASIG